MKRIASVSALFLLTTPVVQAHDPRATELVGLMTMIRVNGGDIMLDTRRFASGATTRELSVPKTG